MLKSWDDLEYWDSQDWIRIQENLDALDQRGVRYCPQRDHIFDALHAVPCDSVKVIIVGQDPYPDPVNATGYAYSVPDGQSIIPPSLHNIFIEYVRDLGHPYPTTGNLARWVEQGVVLWNAIPTCTRGMSKSHDWSEWKSLTTEIIQKIPAVYCFMGHVAKRFVADVPPERMSDVVLTAHPANRHQQFRFCRMFSTINSKLVDPIDWKLS